jgi:hypothetical protein
MMTFAAGVLTGAVALAVALVVGAAALCAAIRRMQ